MILAAAVSAQGPAPIKPSSNPAILGLGEGDLRLAFGDAMQAVPIEAHGTASAVPEKMKVPAEPIAPGTKAPPEPVSVAKNPVAGQLRLVRAPKQGSIRRVEYELFHNSVYRVRWQLALRFERPIMAALVANLTAQFGKPYYDQLIEGKFGSGRATLRRAAWRSENRTLEVRQLNPLVGGPVFLTLSDLAQIKTIISSGGTAAPEPDSIGPWWQDPLKTPPPVTPREREALVAAFAQVVADTHWMPPASKRKP